MAPRPPLRKLEGPHGRGTGPASRPLPKPSPPRASTPARGGHASRLPANGRAVGLAPARGLQRRGGAGSESGPEEAACAPRPPTVEGEGLPWEVAVPTRSRPPGSSAAGRTACSGVCTSSPSTSRPPASWPGDRRCSVAQRHRQDSVVPGWTAAGDWCGSVTACARADLASTHTWVLRFGGR